MPYLICKAGTEMDLVLDIPKHGRWAIEIKRGLTARPGKGFHNAHEDLQPDRSFVVHSGDERYPLAEDIEAIGLSALAQALAEL